MAGSLLLLHTFIPHEHHAEINQVERIQQHQQADDLFDLLQLVFHNDLGEEHLENFRTTCYFFIPSDTFDQELLTPTYYLVQSTPHTLEDVSFSFTEEIHILSFRGPPLMS